MILGVLLDEHYPKWWAGAISGQRPSVQVRRIGGPDAPPMGTQDPDILVWCEARQFILVTDNRKSMPGHLKAHTDAGRHIPGIFLAAKGCNIRQLASDLELVIGASLPDEFQDQIRNMPV